MFQCLAMMMGLWTLRIQEPRTVLVVQKSAVVASDLAEAVRDFFGEVDIHIFRSLAEAHQWFQGRLGLDLAILPDQPELAKNVGFLTRLSEFSTALVVTTERAVPTYQMLPQAAILPMPFTNKMLDDVLRRITFAGA